MKLAHHLRKSDGFTMSEALTLAWSKAKRDDFYMIIEVRKPMRTNVQVNYNSMDSYYRNGAYSGD